jgi:hypothetical protein
MYGSFREGIRYRSDGRALQLLTMLDESSGECLAIGVSRHPTGENVLARLG